MNADYWIYEDSFIFKPEFNGSLDNYIDIISNCGKLIFSNYDDVKVCIKTNNKFDDNYRENYNRSKFNQQISGGVFDKLTQLQQLTFGFYFNQPVMLSYGNCGVFDKLTQLQLLTFGYSFNQPVGKSLDKLIQLKQLTFGVSFNKPVGDGVFDKLSQLQQLTFGDRFNQTVDGIFDKLSQLQQLTFGHQFTQQLDIPSNIKILKLNCNNVHIINNLPNGVEELVLGYNFNLDLNDLPNSIKIISFDPNSFYYKELNNLPKSLEKLYLPEKYDKEIKNINSNCQIIYQSNKN